MHHKIADRSGNGQQGAFNVQTKTVINIIEGFLLAGIVHLVVCKIIGLEDSLAKDNQGKKIVHTFLTSFEGQESRPRRLRLITMIASPLDEAAFDIQSSTFGSR